MVVGQDLLGDTNQRALSQVRQERAAAATRLADFQESRRRLAAKREEQAAKRVEQAASAFAKRKECRLKGGVGVARRPTPVLRPWTTTDALRCLGSSKRVLPPAAAEAEEESESDSEEEEEEGPPVEDLAAFGIVARHEI